MFKERRRHPRLVIPLEAQYRLAGSDSPRLGTLENLSAGGAAMITDDNLEAGAELTNFNFTLPPGETSLETSIEVKAVVVRNEPHLGVGRDNEKKLGLTFLYADDDHFKLVQDFVFERLRRGDRAADYLPIEKRRIPFHEPVVVAYDKYEDFVEEVSENLSMNGMFIRSEEPKRPGNAFSFEFRLGDDLPLIQGRADVAWRRLTSDGPDKPAGMGVHFLNIDMRSRDLIKRLVKAHTLRKMQAEGIQLDAPTPRQKAKPVEPRPETAMAMTGVAVAAAAEVVADALESAMDLEESDEVAPELPVPPPQPAKPEGSSKSPLVVAVIGAIILLAVILAFWLSRSGSKLGANEPPAQESSAIAQRQAASLPAAAAEVPNRAGPVAGIAAEKDPESASDLPDLFEATPTAAVETTTSEPPMEEEPGIEAADSGDLSGVEPTLLDWAQAWSTQRVDDYLGFYATEFVPPDGLSRDDWESQRFTRLRKPAWIKVELEGIRYQPLGDDRVSVSFAQAYSSDTFSDSVAKTLELVREDGGWKIASEKNG